MACTDFLTDRTIQNLKPGPRPYKKADGLGMLLLVNPDGSKYWRFRYRFDGKDKSLALGVYPDVTLKRAREKRTEARALLDRGVDPLAARRTDRIERRTKAATTFEAVSLEWLGKQRAKWSDSHANIVQSLLERDLFPSLGSFPMGEITPPLMLDTLRKIEARGALVTLSKARICASQVFRYAIGSGRATSDPTRDLRGQFQVRTPRNYARLAEKDLPDFLAKLETYDGNLLTQLALRLLVLTFVRTGELRGARWPEIDFDKREWRVPAERMKMGTEHLVPLSRQAIAVLRELQELTGGEDFIFPNDHRGGVPMSENTILFALYRLGYRGRATGHGFRATASTILNEQGWQADVIESQLAHKEPNKIRAAYNHAQYLPERRRMMQAWADFLDAKRAAGEKVVSMRRRA